MTHYGLLGFPLVHSFSRQFFNDKFRQENIHAEYLNFEIEHIDLLPTILQEYPDLKGLNVTIPYKEKVIPYLNELSHEAQNIGAVNCIQITTRHGKPYLKGYNADVIGFVKSINPLLHHGHTKALILGIGGASKAVRYGLETLGLECRFVSRTPRDGVLGYGQLTSSIIREYTVIINCTPVGTFPETDACPDIPYGYITPDHLLYDLIYNPDKTLFLQRGEQHGATIKNGLEMLHLQALASWEFWHEKI